MLNYKTIPIHHYAYTSDVECSPLLDTDSEAAAWLAERMVGHLVGHHRVNGRLKAFVLAVEEIRRSAADVWCPLCRTWHGGVRPVESANVPPWQPVSFVVEIRRGEQKAGQVIAPFSMAMRGAYAEFARHLGEAHHEMISTDMRMEYSCPWCEFQIRVGPLTELEREPTAPPPRLDDDDEKDPI